VIFKDYIEQEKYPDLVRSCDIGIISLSKKNHTDIVPGKLVGYLAGKLPIFANVNKESVDLQEILNQSKSGVFNTSENKSEMLSKFNKLIEFSEERRVMGIKGNQYLKEHFEVSKVAEDILKLINER
jgi:glycosyltransferase involved in cell wall biosynthesis